ncbi:MAG: glycosyltransferase family 4 protein [Patescibacteria group bacterium]
MTKTKIIIVTPFYQPYPAGISSYFQSLVKSLSDRVDFTILTTSLPNQKRDEIKNNCLILRLIPNVIKSSILLRIPVLTTTVFYQLARLNSRERPAAIHVHSSTAMTLGASIYSLLWGTPLIMEVQDIMAPGWLLRMGRVKKYIATGQTVRKRLESMGIKSDKIVTIYSLPPSNIKEITMMTKSEQTVKCLYVGELNTDVKGLDTLLESFKEAQQQFPDLTLKMIGEGPDKNFCLDYIDRFNLKKKISLTGGLGRSATLQEMAACDILILASRSEGVPRVILEAFYFEKAVIASSVGGIVDVIDHQKTGLLFRVNNNEQLTTHIITLARDESQRRLLGQNGKAFLDSLGNWPEIAQKVFDSYQAN